MNRLPNSVPLPEVNDYTDDKIVFGSLGLPIGFDEERLLVNLRTIERIRTIAGLGIVSVIAVDGKAGQQDYQPAALNADGTAAVGRVAKGERYPLAKSNVDFPYPKAALFGRPDVVVRLNRAEMDERIREKADKYPRQLLEPELQAKLINRSLKKGLIDAAAKANTSSHNPTVKALWAGILLNQVIDGDLTISTNTYMLAHLLMRALPAIDASRNYGIDLKLFMKNYRNALVPGLGLDRHLAAAGLAATSRLIRARK